MIVFNKVDAYTYVEKAEDDLTPKTQGKYYIGRTDEDMDGEIE